MSEADRTRCTCEGRLHEAQCPVIRQPLEAFVEGERKAWRAFDLQISQKRRDFAGALYRSVRIYEEQRFRKGGDAVRALAGSGGKGRALFAPVEAGMEAYGRATAQPRGAYFEAFAQASTAYRETVAPLRAAFEAARLRTGPGGAQSGSADSIPWLPGPPGESTQAPPPSMSWLLPATAFALFVAAASLTIQGLSDPGLLLLAFMLLAVALLGLCAWTGAAAYWKLSVVVLAAGALNYGSTTGQWTPALAALAMAVLILGAFSGLARKTFLRKTAAEGSTP